MVTVEPNHHDVLVIGAGSAGLGVAAELGRLGVEAVVLERANAVGASWRARYEGLRLNNDRWSARLPRSMIPRRAGLWPTREEFIAYLDHYATRHRVDIRFGVEVQHIERNGRGWRLRTSGDPLLSRFIVVCTGHDRSPNLPAWPGAAGFEGELLHAAEFQDAARFKDKDVLVVGIGTSATEIAVRLAPGARRVRLAVRTGPNLMPTQFLGVPITVLARLFEGAPAWLVDRLGRLVQRLGIGDLTRYGLPPAPYGVATELAIKGMGPVIDRGFLDALGARRMELVAALEGFEGKEVRLSDGARIHPEVVIAATGYRSGLETLVGHLDVLTPDGKPVAHGPEEHAGALGLFFNGYQLPLSGELSGMRRGATQIARRIAQANNKWGETT